MARVIDLDPTLPLPGLLRAERPNKEERKLAVRPTKVLSMNLEAESWEPNQDSSILLI